MSLSQLILLALIQGITEWLPISSSGHVLLFSNYVGVTGRDELLVNAMSNLGTLLALLIYFRKDVISASLGGFELIRAPFSKTPLSSGGRLALHILIATIVALVPILAFTVAIPEAWQTQLRSVYTVAATTIVFGLFLWWADARGGEQKTEQDMTMRHALLIGASQALAALLPGTSRSGITMTVARALGYARTEAARFSMLIGAPLVAAAGLFGAIGLLDNGSAADVSVTFSDGLVVAGFAFLSGIASIWALMTLLQRMSFLPFVIYRLVLGVVLLLASPLAFHLI